MELDGLTVLLVEDEAIIGFALEDALDSRGAVPVLVSGIEEARRALGEHSFDAAILDVNLKGETSYPLAADLRAAGVPILFATGYGRVAHPEEFAGTMTVTKPYNGASIARALQAAIADAPAGRASAASPS